MNSLQEILRKLKIEEHDELAKKREERMEAQIAAEKEEQIARRRKSALLNAQVPKEYRDALLDLWDTPANKEVEAWYLTDTPFLVLIGDSYQGKTVAACHAIELACHGWFESAHSLLNMLPHRTDYWEPANEARVLVVDELGAEWRGEYSPALQNLQQLIVTRSSKGKRTIFTTNLDYQTLFDVYSKTGSGKIVNRLSERGKIVELYGPPVGRKPRLVRDP